MEKIKHYVLPENTNRLYKEEAISSIGLTREVAEKINEIVDALNLMSETDLRWKQTQEGIIRKGVIYMKDNLINTLTDLLKIYDYDTIKRMMIEAYGKDVCVFVTPQMFGALGDGSIDETANLQKAIDEANKKGRVLCIPRGVYKISAPLILNGCTVIGEPGNVYHGQGTVIECRTKDFTAFKQGSTNTVDIMFNLVDLIVKNAKVGYEIVYAINSKFERLYAIDCTTGFKLGSSDSVGSMFCEFNNLYTDGCVVGVEVDSSQYFNNNRFNNGFLQGSEKAMSLNVTGGYGAIDNVFNNVEFRSIDGRGIELSSALNTVFNSCYFECAGNALRTLNFCTVIMRDCIYGSFVEGNGLGDVNVVYSVGGSAFTFNGGTVFLDLDYSNMYFFGTGNDATHQNVLVEKNIVKNGSAEGFAFFSKHVKTVTYAMGEQVTLTGTVTISAGESKTVPFEYGTPFDSVPNVVLFTMRGASGADLHTIVSDRTATGGSLTVKNTGSTALSVSFMVYAKMI